MGLRKGLLILKYRDFEIKVTREDEGYSGGSYRLIDNWELDYWYNPSIKNRLEALNECKITIDDYYDSPEDYED